MSDKFKCRKPDQDGEAWTNVTADYPEEAARSYAEDCDSSAGGGLFHDGAEFVVIVRDSAGIERKFTCTMELTPVYDASEIDPKPDPASDIPI